MFARFVTVLSGLIFFSNGVIAQLSWQNVDSLYQPLPSSVHIFKATDSLDGKPNIAFYVIADLKDKKLDFTIDTTNRRRLTPSEFFERNNKPLLVVNTTFFSYETNQSLNLVIKDGKLLSYNTHSLPGKGKDTLTYRHPFGSAIGLSKKGKPDVAWTYTDSLSGKVYFIPASIPAFKDSVNNFSLTTAKDRTTIIQNDYAGKHSKKSASFRKWNIKTAVGGGPVLLQNGVIRITNNEELKFTGKAIEDKHPRTAMGYTKDQKLIFLVIQGRFPGIAEGATLGQEAQILKDIGCVEALNLDGGGSSCLLINGKQTIQPSDKQGQRPVPAVFIIRN